MTRPTTTTHGTKPPQLRLAIALNGGVSLAVWMGGVVDELLRFSRGEGAYADVCEKHRPQIDVITGASAGGLNGVFLALGLVFQHQNLSLLRDLWLEQGSFDRLMRDPYERPMPSLLKGDSYFLPELQRVIERLMGGTPARAEVVPIDLRLTVTSLTGEVSSTPDAFGGVMRDMRHDVVLHFTRGGDDQTRTDGRPPRDDFDSSDLAERQRIAARLARAGRSSASFPGAFEASYCEIEGESDAGFLRQQAAGFTMNRFLIDGGVLVNLPVKPALEAIIAKPAGERVRRVLAAIVPDPAPVAASKPDDADDPPSAKTVVAKATVSIPRVQSIANFIKEVKDNNVRVGTNRAQRFALIRSMSRDEILSLGERLFDTYRTGRLEGSRENFAWDLVGELGRRFPERTLPTVEDARKKFKELGGEGGLPWVPSRDDSERRLPLTGWGASTVRRTASLLLQILDEAAEEGNARVPGLKLAVHLSRMHASSLVESLSSIGEGVAKAVDSPKPQEVWAKTTEFLSAWPSRPSAKAEGDQDLLEALDRDLHDLATVLKNLVDSLSPPGTDQTVIDETPDPEASLGSVIARQLSGARIDTYLRWLLSFEVVQGSFVGFESQPDQEVDLIQISTLRPAPLDPLGRRTATAKLGGSELGHFGGFLKRSWRANDWMWGRLDAASHIAAILHGNDQGGFRALAMAAQQRIAREELPVVADAVQLDLDDGGQRGSRGAAFLRAWKRATVNDIEPSVEALAALLGACQIGEETIAEELGSDLLTRTAASALATATTLLVENKPPLLGSFIRPLRALALTLWASTRTALGRNVGARVLAGIIFGLSLAGVSAQLFAKADLGVLALPAWIAFVAGAIIAFLRAPMVAIPLVVVAGIPGVLANLPSRPPKYLAPLVDRWPSLAGKPHWIPVVAFIAGWMAIALSREWRPIRWLRLSHDRVAADGRAERQRLREKLGSDTGVGSRTALITLWVGGLAVTGGKNWFVTTHPSELRTLIFLGTGALAVTVIAGAAFGRSRVLDLLGVVPLRFEVMRAGELSGVFGFAALLLVALAALTRPPSLSLALIASVSLAMLIGSEVSRALRKDPAPKRLPDDISGSPAGGPGRKPQKLDRAVLWTVAPAFTLFAISLAVARTTGSGGRLLERDEVLRLLIVTALGEELLFRGLLFGLSLLSTARRSNLVPSVLFGLWHLMDAVVYGNAQHFSWRTTAIYAGATVLAMTLVSAFVLCPLRLRSRSIWGGVFLHASSNLSGAVLWHPSST